MASLIVHERVTKRHPELTEEGVKTAWENALMSTPRIAKDPDEYVALGFDDDGRLLEVVATRLRGGNWLIFRATTPPSDKTFSELGIERRQPMEFIATNGTDLTDELLDSMAKEYESGTWSRYGEITRGRPRIYDEDMETVSFRIPKSRIAAHMNQPDTPADPSHHRAIHYHQRRTWPLVEAPQCDEPPWNA